MTLRHSLGSIAIAATLSIGMIAANVTAASADKFNVKLASGHPPGFPDESPSDHWHVSQQDFVIPDILC